MPYRKVPCPNQCGSLMEPDSRECSDCRKRTRKEAAGLRFEPQSIPIEDPPPSRPWNDPRNNWRLPNWNQGQAVRNPVVSPIRVCVVDLESTALDASFGRILCAVFQFFSPDDRVVLRADDYQPWKDGRRADDSQLLADVLKVLEQADVLIAHNGVKYDMAF